MQGTLHQISIYLQGSQKLESLPCGPNESKGRKNQTALLLLQIMHLGFCRQAFYETQGEMGKAGGIWGR